MTGSSGGDGESEEGWDLDPNTRKRRRQRRHPAALLLGLLSEQLLLALLPHTGRLHLLHEALLMQLSLLLLLASHWLLLLLLWLLLHLRPLGWDCPWFWSGVSAPRPRQSSFSFLTRACTLLPCAYCPAGQQGMCCSGLALATV
jgi:hypothetical protein